MKKGQTKLKRNLDDYTLLIDLIMSLSPLQAKNLLSELLPRYTKRMRTRTYNEEGELDPNGKVRLTEYQYKAIRTNFGDTYLKKAFTEMSNYIKYLEKNVNNDSKCKVKLKQLNSKTHNAYIGQEDGWVFQKCKNLIFYDRPKVQINPYLIDDLNTAREYIKSIPKNLIDESMDIKLLIMKFPELKDEIGNAG